jgi:hypothetical protein
VLGKWIINGTIPNPVDMGTIGCNGVGGFKYALQDNYQDPQLQKCGIITCEIVHERSHITDVEAAAPNICVNQPPDAQIGYSTNEEAVASELKAWLAHLDCLQGKRGSKNGAGIPCLAECETVLDDTIEQMNTGIAKLRNGILP